MPFAPLVDDAMKLARSIVWFWLGNWLSALRDLKHAQGVLQAD